MKRGLLNKRLLQRGLTLMETLVTLVLVSLVAGLIAEGLHQIARAERGLEGQQLQARLKDLHRRWVLEILEGLVVRRAEAGERFAGDAHRLTGVSTQLPLASELGAEPFLLVLKSSDAEAETALMLELPRRAVTVELMRLPLKALSWRFTDDQGTVQSIWPPTSDWRGAALPASIELRDEAGANLVLLAAPKHNANMPAPRRSVTEQL